jgi:hypothetical protein
VFPRAPRKPDFSNRTDPRYQIRNIRSSLSDESAPTKKVWQPSISSRFVSMEPFPYDNPNTLLHQRSQTCFPSTWWSWTFSNDTLGDVLRLILKAIQIFLKPHFPQKIWSNFSLHVRASSKILTLKIFVNKFFWVHNKEWFNKILSTCKFTGSTS